MLFKGTGMVKWKDRVIANFAYDGYFETDDPGVIQRLILCDYHPVEKREGVPEPVVAPVVAPEVAPEASVEQEAAPIAEPAPKKAKKGKKQ